MEKMDCLCCRRTRTGRPYSSQGGICEKQVLLSTCVVQDEDLGDLGIITPSISDPFQVRDTPCSINTPADFYWLRDKSRASSKIRKDLSHNKEIEEIFNERKRKKRKRTSVSRFSSRLSSKNRADLSHNQELEEIFNEEKPKKRKRLGRKKWTHIKSCSRQARSAHVWRSSSPDVPSRNVQTENCRELSPTSYLNWCEELREEQLRKRLLDCKEKHCVTRSVMFYCAKDNCTLCAEDVEDITEHMVRDHDLMPYYKCNDCGNCYITKQHLRLHAVIHDTSPVQCGLCGTILSNVATFQKHIYEHNTFSVLCPYCDLLFTSERLCKKHVRTQHKGKQYHMCYQQQIVIDTVYYSKPVFEESNGAVGIVDSSAMLSPLPSDEENIDNNRESSDEISEEINNAFCANGDIHRYECVKEGCPVIFQDIEYITEHMWIDHEYILSFKCEECGKCYVTKEHLRAHKSLHDQAPVICFRCRELIPNVELLHKHIEAHDKLSIQCRYCDLSFLSELRCAQHVDLSHKHFSNDKVTDKRKP